MPADSVQSLHRNPIVYGICIALVICGVLLAALLVDRIVFAGSHLQVRSFTSTPVAVALVRSELFRHVALAAVAVDPEAPTVRVVEGAPPESVLAF